MSGLQKDFPEHWGNPPRIQTKDLRPLPGGYGRGSSTLAGWIKNNMEADAQGRPQSQSLRVLQAEKKAAEDAKKAEEESRAVRVAHQEKEALEAQMEELESGGKGSYMKHDAEWYRKWQYRKEYSDNRDKRYVKNYHTFRESPHMRRMQMQMMHGM